MRKVDGFKVAVVLLTYNRVEEAKVNMRLIRLLWSSCLGFGRVDIYHMYNGKRGWYPRESEEDVCIRCENPGHFGGVVLMANRGIREVLKSSVEYDYVMMMSADVWLYKPDKLVELMRQMDEGDYWLCASRWFDPRALGTELVIITPGLAKQVFPLDLNGFVKKHVLVRKLSGTIRKYPVVERCFAEKVRGVLEEVGQKMSERVMWTPRRSWVFFHNHHRDDNIGYLSMHDVGYKGRLLREKIDEKYLSSLVENGLVV